MKDGFKLKAEIYACRRFINIDIIPQVSFYRSKILSSGGSVGTHYGIRFGWLVFSASLCYEKYDKDKI